MGSVKSVGRRVVTLLSLSANRERRSGPFESVGPAFFWAALSPKCCKANFFSQFVLLFSFTLGAFHIAAVAAAAVGAARLSAVKAVAQS